MIYCDHQIEKAIRHRRLMIDPSPDPSQFDSTSLNLRVGDDVSKQRTGLSSTSQFAVMATPAVDGDPSPSLAVALGNFSRPQFDAGSVTGDGQSVPIR
jgi:hypothetical protein